MKKQNYLMLSIIAIAITLTACNGGSSGGGGPTPPHVVNFAYFTNYGNNGIGNDSYTQCHVGVSGIEPNTCLTITPKAPGALSQPEGLAFYKGRAYFSNNGNNSYTQCDVTNSSIDSSSCNTYTPGLNIMQNPSTVAIYNDIAYFTYEGNNSASGYTQCNINDSGIILPSCAFVEPTGGDGLDLLDKPTGLTFIDGYAYFSNWTSSYTQCNVAVNGAIEPNTCTTIEPPVAGVQPSLGTPFNVAFYNNIAYFTDYASGYYTQCSTDGVGVIEPNTCVSIKPPGQYYGSALSASTGLAFYNNVADRKSVV